MAFPAPRDSDLNTVGVGAGPRGTRKRWVKWVAVSLARTRREEVTWIVAELSATVRAPWQVLQILVACTDRGLLLCERTDSHVLHGKLRLRLRLRLR